MNQTSIFIPTNGGKQQVELDEIMALEAWNNYVKVITRREIYYVRITLEVLMTKLPDSFVQIHRSWAIGIPYIDIIKREFLTTIHAPGKEIPIGKKYYHGLIKKLRVIEPTGD